MEIKNVLFDLDGTMLDTTVGVIESVIYAAQSLGFEKLPYDTMLKFVGPPIQNSFIEYYGCNPKLAQQAANIFRTYYKEKALLKACPYNGIYDLCEKLKAYDIKMTVATYKREDYALTILKHFDFDKYCISMHGADNENILTKADIVQLCIEEIGGKTEDTVLIGDTVHDATSAEKAGVAFLGVTYGFGFKSKEDVDEYPNIGCADSPIKVLDYIGF